MDQFVAGERAILAITSLAVDQDPVPLRLREREGTIAFVAVTARPSVLRLRGAPQMKAQGRRGRRGEEARLGQIVVGRVEKDGTAGNPDPGVASQVLPGFFKPGGELAS